MRAEDCNRHDSSGAAAETGPGQDPPGRGLCGDCFVGRAYSGLACPMTEASCTPCSLPSQTNPIRTRRKKGAVTRTERESGLLSTCACWRGTRITQSRGGPGTRPSSAGALPPARHREAREWPLPTRQQGEGSPGRRSQGPVHGLEATSPCRGRLPSVVQAQDPRRHHQPG